MKGKPAEPAGLLDPQGLSAQAIRSFLEEGGLWLDVQIYDQVGSTNNLAKEAAGKGRSVLIAARSQTEGRGRRGRSFFSPPDAGLYFSLTLGWDREELPVLVTTMAAVAVARVLEERAGIRAGIKWVNDLYWEGRKICGILTEGVSRPGENGSQSLVVGIGLNLTRPQEGYPEEIRDKAGAIGDQAGDLDRNRLVALIVRELLQMVQSLPDRSYLDDYRDRCFILGRPVRLETGETIIPHGISDEGALLYLKEGEIQALHSGQVSIQP